jgi:hypothetical protein
MEDDLEFSENNYYLMKIMQKNSKTIVVYEQYRN